MKDLIVASCNGKQYTRYEKVTAYNVFTNEPNRKFIGMCIDKFREEDKLSFEESARKSIVGDYILYNVGEYRVEKQIQDFAQIAIWNEVEERIRISRKSKKALKKAS